MIESRDEDTLVIPRELRRHLHPRRGGTPVPPIKTDGPAVALLRGHRPDAAAIDARLVGDPGWNESVRRHLAGEPDPVGAALIARIAGVEPLKDMAATYLRIRDAAQNVYVEAWIAEYGLAFAACALVELGTVRVEPLPGRDRPLRPWRMDDAVLNDQAARRMRARLAAATEDDHLEAVERLAAHRRDAARMAIASYLVPTRPDWLDECRDGIARVRSRAFGLLRRAFCTPEQLAVEGVLPAYGAPIDLLVTLAEGAGADALPLFLTPLDEHTLSDADRRRLLEVIALLPADAAFRALVDRVGRPHVKPALIAAMNRFPVRALRLLGAGGRTDLLADHVRIHPELTAAWLPGLPAEARAAVEATTAAPAGVAVAAGPGELPPMLTEPPWTRDRARAKPVVITGLTPPVGCELTWARGEREEWSGRRLAFSGDPYPDGTDWEEEVRKYRDGEHGFGALFAQGPEGRIRPLLAEWDTRPYWHSDDVPWLEHLAGRFGADALPVVIGAVRDSPAVFGGVIVPFLSAEVAELMAAWATRRGHARRTAAAWFGRQGAGAARMLVPAALDKARKRREPAEAALRTLAGQVGAQDVIAAAREYGPEVADAIAALLATDPLEVLPARVPDPPDWASPAVLPQILLRGRERALPGTATAHVLTMLAMSSPGATYAGVDVVRDLCDRRSLAEFGWAVFQRWEDAGAPAKEIWALDQLGPLGDDGTVRRLTPKIRAWPGAGGSQKATNGVEVLGAIGTDLALLHLQDIAQNAKFKALKARARDKIEQIADTRGLTAEQVGDRLVPDLGLDPDGSMALDYGPRRFTVGFDETLTPFVLDGDGRMRKTLPKPAAGDDPELAPAAHERFTLMKKVVRTAATDQIRRLEKAMISGRGWTAAEFQDLFVAHPLIRHIARRLVWRADDGTVFRIAEDGTPADVDDKARPLPDGATVRIAHPLDLGADITAWGELLDDYEILQPFPQVRRAVHTLTDEERRAARLTRFEGRTVPITRVFALARRDWERPDSGTVSRPLPGGRQVRVDLYPGLDTSYGYEDQEIRAVRLTEGTFGALDPVTASELIADLSTLE